MLTPVPVKRCFGSITVVIPGVCVSLRLQIASIDWYNCSKGHSTFFNRANSNTLAVTFWNTSARSNRSRMTMCPLNNLFVTSFH